MLLTSPKKAGQGYRCQTDGCDAQKIWIDREGNVVRELLSSVVREVPLTHIVLNESYV